MNGFYDLISRRESCRHYQNRPVEKEKLIACMEAARLAPSACNSQPWTAHIVSNPKLAAEIAATTQAMGMNRFTSQCPAFIVITEDKAQLTATVASKYKSQDFAAVDIGIMAAHIVLMATEQGLGSCILGWFDEEKIKGLLEIDKKRRVRLVIALGYSADERLRPKIRKPLEKTSVFID